MKRHVWIPALALVAVTLSSACGADFWVGPAHPWPKGKQPVEPPIDGLWGPGSEIWLHPEPPRPICRKPTPDNVSDSLKQLQGKWKVAAIERAGKCQALDGPQPESETVLTVEGDSFRRVISYRAIDGLRFTETGTIRLDPSTDPKSIELVFRETRLDPCRHGIYVLADGEWTLCLAPNGFRQEQPKRFTTTGTQNTTFTLKRVSE
jgi:uncharacterized protein (TIGR03067 family)